MDERVGVQERFSAPPADPDVVEQLAAKYSTWGRWGEHDEAGTLNEAGREQVGQAAALVRDGAVFSLSLNFDANGPQSGEFGRVNPIHTMLQDGGDILAGAQRHLNMEYTDDAVYMPLQCGTQWDALSHSFYRQKMYNGHGPERVTSAGAEKNSIDKVASRFVGRGVLADLPRYAGRPWLDPGEPITSEVLADCLAAQRVELRPGDFLMVRTGHLAAARARGAWGDYVGGSSPGLSVHAAPLLCETRVAAVAIDTWTTEVWPAEVPAIRTSVHVILLVHAGIHLGEMFDLDALAEACAVDGRFEFLFVAPALPITGAVGSPVNPLALR
ncbi:cyclase family protein [Nocardioides bigeumensis]|uniref:Cyclase family protein n=1 Tax=Nocardioides bigeumensis TaxID=433657 RepID=A0ABN2YWJ0_9ACTN